MKPILFLLAAIALPTTLFGQGQIFFANDSSTRFSTNGGFGRVGYMTGVDAYRIGLYTAPAGTVNESLFTLVATATNTANPAFLGLFSYPESPYTFSANNHTPIAVQVRAWSLFAGSSWEQARSVYPYLYGQAVYLGKTEIGYMVPSIGGSPPESLFGQSGPGPFGVFTSGIVLYGPIPEPSIYVLAALGAFMLFCFRPPRKRAARESD